MTSNEIKIIIIDDESSARNILTHLLNEIKTDIKLNVVATCENLIDGVHAIKTLNPDLVFVDIQMPFHSGLELNQFVNTNDFFFVYITAYNQHAIAAFEKDAADYILKPIRRKRLEDTMLKISRKIQQKREYNHYKSKAELSAKINKKLKVKDLQETRLIPYEQIIAMEAKGSYCIIHLKNSNQIVASRNLKYFYNLLEAPHEFFRSHKAWLINLKHVTKINQKSREVFLGANFIAKCSQSNLKTINSLIT